MKDRKNEPIQEGIYLDRKYVYLVIIPQNKPWYISSEYEYNKFQPLAHDIARRLFKIAIPGDTIKGLQRMLKLKEDLNLTQTLPKCTNKSIIPDYIELDHVMDKTPKSIKGK